MLFMGFAARRRKNGRIQKQTWINKDYGSTEETAKEAYRVTGKEDIWTDACWGIEKYTLSKNKHNVYEH
jgi:hypothetical protein